VGNCRSTQRKLKLARRRLKGDTPAGARVCCIRSGTQALAGAPPLGVTPRGVSSWSSAQVTLGALQAPAAVLRLPLMMCSALSHIPVSQVCLSWSLVSPSARLWLLCLRAGMPWY
jgi:hypothetical protein